MSAYVDAPTLKAWLSDEAEIALLDVREHGQYGEGHPFFAVPAPYSRLELRLAELVPNKIVRLVLCDDGDGVAERAAARAEALGYEKVHILQGGAVAWETAGFTLYAGVNVPSKTFGELVDHECDTPRITADALKAMKDAGENFILVDGRPFAEYEKMNVPGGICCPNGELALRIADIAPDPETQIIVNCAGRTRSIIGAQTLIDLGIPNRVAALENGTQGWFLAGLELEHRASRRYPQDVAAADLESLRKRARALSQARGASFVSAEQAAEWRVDPNRTTYLFDVRTGDEFSDDGVAGTVHAPGGQLIQATDQWVGVRGARLVLADGEEVRAPMVAAWLRQLGHEAYMVDGGVDTLRKTSFPTPPPPTECNKLKEMAPDALATLMDQGAAQVIDVRPSMAYRAGHLAEARWSIRPRISTAVSDTKLPIVVATDDLGVAALAIRDITEAGGEVAGVLRGRPEEWRAAGLTVVKTPDQPADADCIDFLFFTRERHQGNAAAARQYLAWEIGLIDQLDVQERGAFRIVPAP